MMKGKIFSDFKKLLDQLVGKTLCFFVGVYQYCISPFMVNSCRYHPSCSVYCRESIHRFGAIKGSLLTLKRLAKCHPLSQGGYDPIPEHSKE